MGGGEIVKKGWLIKSPPLEGGGIKAWRKRFFCLRTSKVLEYYKGEDGDLKGVVNLEDCKAVHSDLDHKKYKHVFDIETKDRTYYLVASTSEEMKSWVDTICRVCGFIFQMPVEEPPTPQSAPKTLPSNLSSSPNITAPTSAGGIPLTERFKTTSQNGSQSSEDFYSLATAAGNEVQKQLSGGDQEVPAGTPLAEALAFKGLGNSQYSTATAIDPTDTATYRATKLSDSSYFVPRHGDSPTVLSAASAGDPVYSLYQGHPARPPNSLSPVPKSRAATMHPPAQNRGDPVTTTTTSHKPLTGSQSLTGSSDSSGASSRVGGAEEMSNGYMRPRPINRVPNYDYLPFGPPRPAPNQQGQSTSPKQHRSALLKMEASSSKPGDGRHSYVNVQRTDLPPPPIDRSSKPSAPLIDRSNKPKQSDPVSSSSGTGGGGEGTLGGSSPSSSVSSESPPEFPTRCESLSNTLDGGGTTTTTTDEYQRTAALAESDIPKPSSRTTQYTQIQFDPSSNRMVMKEEQEGEQKGEEDPLAFRGPVPAPRKKVRVNYSDVDLRATSVLASQRQVSLGQAEIEHLQEKPYVNVDRDGVPDDTSDPDYYTHMRNFTLEDADRPQYIDAIYAVAQKTDKPADSDNM